MSGVEAAVVLLVGLVAGMINTVAGGGSVLTIPILVELGMPSTVANATNRVAVVLQSAAGTATFARHDLLDVHSVVRLMPAGLVGAGLGAFGAATIDDAVFRLVLAIVFGVLGLLFVAEALLGARISYGRIRAAHPAWLHVTVLLVGAYSGFLQAGVGVVLLVVLHLLADLDLRRANAVKGALVLCWGGIALLIFAHAGLVRWAAGLLLGLGGVLGAWLGATVAVRVSQRALKLIVALAVLAAAGRLAGIY